MLANEETAHVALPKLYGAPAYARPTVVPVMRLERPFDPDALPLEAQQTEEERQLAQELAAEAWLNASVVEPEPATRGGTGLKLRARPFRLPAITRRIGGGRAPNGG
jgi:hypothetical protein